MRRMNVELRKMRTGLAAASALLALLLWSMAGCGGSGSSGFDISPLTEGQAIARAIDRNECVAVDEQTICASGVEPAAGDFQGASVTIAPTDAPVVCDAGGSPEKDCTTSLEFRTEGFTIPNSLVAAISETERGPWVRVPVTVSEDVTGPRTVAITVPARAESRRKKPLLAAVIVYAGPPPESVSAASEHLGDFGGDLVYVSQRFEIVIPALADGATQQ